MKLTQHLSIKEALELHEQTVSRHGGSQGVRDLGLLESSLYRAKSGYYETLSELAAALMQSFCMNHPFVDGNKRVALLVMAVFLRINGYRLKVTNPAMVKFIISGIIEGKLSVTDISKWIAKADFDPSFHRLSENVDWVEGMGTVRNTGEAQARQIPIPVFSPKSNGTAEIALSSATRSTLPQN